jgi:hypothetical protein
MVPFGVLDYIGVDACAMCDLKAKKKKCSTNFSLVGEMEGCLRFAFT